VAIAGIDRDWIGREFDQAEFQVRGEDIVAYAKACGESEPRFTDPAHPDFQAPPTYTAKYVSRRILPESFPHIGARGFDAGKTVHVHGAVRPGDRLTAKSRIADIYEKTGRTGSMVFIVHRMEFTNQHGHLVAVVDWRMVRQPDAE
jgi:hypothetical protein